MDGWRGKFERKVYGVYNGRFKKSKTKFQKKNLKIKIKQICSINIWLFQIYYLLLQGERFFN